MDIAESFHMSTCYLLANFGFDTAENGPSRVWRYGVWTPQPPGVDRRNQYRSGYAYIINGSFVVYGVIYLAAETDSIPVHLECAFYGVCDIFTKSIFSSFIFNTVLTRMYKDVVLSMRYAEDIVDRSEAPY